ncbi:hypothetical protein FSP39_007014 [Pinctada imbricata]|uniref:Protein transport protein sec16 n=1 Tax=Pinctada imbricata TaxID=66713 RepID=A0AA89BYN1_PINIB|nr:hypothetical protein FSP39_007014 [Pinctada imbricata]
MKSNEKLTLDVSATESGIPSPIMSSSEETVTVSHPNTPPVAPKSSQSPILPRKESPFQPPSRRRTLSGQSSGSIEEKPQLESQLSNEGGSKQEKVIETREKSASISSQSSRGSSGKGEPAKSGDKTQSDRERELSKYQERIKKASRPPPGPPRGVMSPRRIESAFQQVQKQRAKHNMSPATSLWAGNNLVLPQTNILLAPAAPASGTGSSVSSAKTSPAKSTKETTRDVLSPVKMLITSLSEKQSKESTPERSMTANDKGSRKPDASRPTDKRYDVGRDRRETRRDISPSRDRHDRGSSIDRELEISRKIEDRDLRKDRDDYYRDRERDYYRDDRYRGRDSRGPRDPRDRDPRDRDPRDRDYDPYQDRRYRDRGYYGDERYDRPRSRHSLLDEERSSSRQGSESERPRSRQDSDRPRSRQEYGRDYYYRDKYGRGYDYDRYYGRGYYDRHGYYDSQYYDNRYYRYDDYYGRGNNYDERYPGQYNDRYGPPYEEGYRQSQRGGSRVHTPGSLSDTGDQPDYAYQYGSRSSSRQGYDDYARSQWEAYYANYNRGYGHQDPYYQEEVRPGRMTPAKHSIPHLCVRFGPGGQLVKVLPNRPADGEPATVEIHDISQVLQDNLETDELKSFPGPLVRGDTHKNDVLVFCQRKAKECLDNVQMMDRESAALIWKYLELLIKQNGTCVGTDVADLLLEGHEPTTVDYSMMGLRIQSQDNLDEELNETTETNFSMVTADRSVINRGKKSVEEVTDRFRHLLLYGRKKDALEWAMKNGLWGHALFLASKMDSRAHANVMTRFANNAMKMNDPLQTLYQLMSGRQPAAVTCITDEKWGDWRPHLAMVLSNHSSRPDIERKSIMTLGDTLASKGFLHASHLCYLMAQCNFGSYQKKTSKMVLIGSNHNLSLKEFATNEAIHCTEIYQYGISLGNPNSFSANFQYFKFLYACRLSENGFAQEALQYLEVIARVVQQSPTLFQPALVKLVYEFANRLKYFDPQRQQSGEETEDPFWLQQLQRINQGFMDGSIQPISGSVTPYGAYGLRAASTESGEVANYTTGADNLVTQQYTGFPFSSDVSQQSGQVVDQSQYHQTGADQGQQQLYQSDLHQHYNQHAQYQHQGHVTHTEGQTTHTDGQTTHVEGQTTHVEGQTTHAEAQPSQEGMTTDQQQQWQQYYYNQGQHYNQYQDYSQQGSVGGQQGTDVSHIEGNQQQGHSDVQPQTHPETSFYQPNMHQPSVPSNQLMNQRGSISSTANGSMMTDDDEEDIDDNEESRDFNDGGHSNFSYFDNVQQTQIVAPRLRKRTESEASNASGDRPHHSSSKHDVMKTEDKPKETKKPDPKQGQPQQQGKGIFGGIMNKLWGNKKNEMKLPNDTKKSIIWDDENKKWKNLDATEEDDKPPPPPPKDTSIPSAGPAPTESTMGPPAGNKFSLRRGAASRYVDVMNSKPAPTKDVPQSLFNVMPSSHSSPAIFSPGGPGDDSSVTDTGQPQPTITQPTITQPAVTQEATNTSGELNNPKTEPSANGMPVMFNPAQFQSSQSTGSFQSGSNRSSGRLRPGQRRHSNVVLDYFSRTLKPSNSSLRIRMSVRLNCMELASLGEESLFMSINLRQRSCFYLGSEPGKEFLGKRMDVIENFYHFINTNYPLSEADLKETLSENTPGSAPEESGDAPAPQELEYISTDAADEINDDDPDYVPDKKDSTPTVRRGRPPLSEDGNRLNLIQEMEKTILGESYVEETSQESPRDPTVARIEKIVTNDYEYVKSLKHKHKAIYVCADCNAVCSWKRSMMTHLLSCKARGGPNPVTTKLDENAFSSVPQGMTMTMLQPQDTAAESSQHEVVLSIVEEDKSGAQTTTTKQVILPKYSVLNDDSLAQAVASIVDSQTEAAKQTDALSKSQSSQSGENLSTTTHDQDFQQAVELIESLQKDDAHHIEELKDNTAADINQSEESETVKPGSAEGDQMQTKPDDQNVQVMSDDSEVSKENTKSKSVTSKENTLAKSDPKADENKEKESKERAVRPKEKKTVQSKETKIGGTKSKDKEVEDEPLIMTVEEGDPKILSALTLKSTKSAKSTPVASPSPVSRSRRQIKVNRKYADYEVTPLRVKKEIKEEPEDSQEEDGASSQESMEQASPKKETRGRKRKVPDRDDADQAKGKDKTKGFASPSTRQRQRRESDADDSANESNAKRRKGKDGGDSSDESKTRAKKGKQTTTEEKKEKAANRSPRRMSPRAQREEAPEEDDVEITEGGAEGDEEEEEENEDDDEADDEIRDKPKVKMTKREIDSFTDPYKRKRGRPKKSESEFQRKQSETPHKITEKRKCGKPKRYAIEEDAVLDEDDEEFGEEDGSEKNLKKDKHEKQRKYQKDKDQEEEDGDFD